jgi:cytochrome P450
LAGPADGLGLSAVPAALPRIEPLPPVVAGRLPWVGGGLGLLRDPTEFFVRQRARHGDTFVLDAFGHRLFCVFSPEGVRSLYAQPEEEASFGLATYTLIKAKVPIELLLGRRNHPKALFGNAKVETYLDNLHLAVGQEIDRLGPSGSFEIFAEMRRLGHRLGLASWSGPEAASPEYIDRLIPLFDALDSSESFVRPDRNVVTWATRKRAERRAMAGIEEILSRIIAGRSGQPPAGDFLDQIHQSYADLPPDEQMTGTARDVIVIHMGSQSNLYAALAWTFINLLQHPDHLEQVRQGDDVLLDRCANESIRMAQRSITMRQVLQPIEVDAGDATYRLSPGTLLTTMLSVHNTSAAPGLETFDPLHYEGRKLRSDVPLPARELVSTFGHGTHSCPAARFSISAIRTSIRLLLEQYEFTPSFKSASPRKRQIGGVARAATPCWVLYRPR